MIVYKPDQLSIHSVFLQPAATPQGRECSEWMDGSEPRTFVIKFTAGRASVPDNLGQYMIDNGLARLSPILLPTDIHLETVHAR